MFDIKNLQQAESSPIGELFIIELRMHFDCKTIDLRIYSPKVWVVFVGFKSFYTN